MRIEAWYVIVNSGFQGTTSILPGAANSFQRFPFVLEEQCATEVLVDLSNIPWREIANAGVEGRNHKFWPADAANIKSFIEGANASAPKEK